MANFYKSAALVFSYAGVQLLSKMLSLAVLYFLAFWVGDGTFGYVSLAQAVFMSCLVFFGFNIQGLFVRYFKERSWSEIANSAFFLYSKLLPLALLVSGVIFLFFSESRYFVWFALLPLAGFLGGISVSYTVYARSVRRFWRYAFSELSRPISLIVFSSVLWFVGKPELVPQFYVISLVFGGGIVFFFVFIKTEFDKKNRVLPKREVASFCLPLFFSQVMSLSNGYADRFVLAFFVSMEDLGKYGKAYLIGTALGMLFDSLMLLWWPYIVSKKESFFDVLYPKALWAYIITVFLSFMVLGSLFVCMWVDFMALPIVEISLVLVAAFLARVGYQIFVPVLNTYDKTHITAKISLYGALVGLFLNFALIPVYGIYGAAYATWGAFFVFSALAYMETRKFFLDLKKETSF